MELDQEALSFETQFANLGPVKGVYLCGDLGEK